MEGLRVDEDDVEVGGACIEGVGVPSTDLRTAAIRCARDLAQRRGEPLGATFQDTLSGDVARLQVWRRLRRLFPNVTLAEAEPLLDEVLAP